MYIRKQASQTFTDVTAPRCRAENFLSGNVNTEFELKFRIIRFQSKENSKPNL